MKKNFKQIISLIIGIFMYFTGFFFISEVGRIIMTLGIMILGINLFIFGSRAKNSNKFIGYFCIFGSIVWLLAAIIGTIISIFINYK
jgi:hypothetical protein